MKIEHDRLIELAEDVSEATAEETQLLASDPELRDELEALGVLFADLRSRPEPRMDAASRAAFLPELRSRIAELKAGGSLAWLPKFRIAHALAAGLSAAIVAAVLLLGSPGAERDAAPVAEITDAGAEELFLAGEATSQLQAEASELEDLELYSGEPEDLPEASAEMLLRESSLGLIEEAALDEQAIANMRSTLAANDEQLKTIENWLSSN